jgi:hypothetical protein
MPYRLEERAFLKQRLLAGYNVLMLAMRRTGKTFLCRLIEADAEKGGYRAAFCNLEGCDDEKAAFSELCGAVEPQLRIKDIAKDRWQQMLRRVIGGQVDAGTLKELLLRTDWRESLRNLLSVLDEDDKPWIIILDELPLFVMKLLRADRVRAANFLLQLRTYRHEFKNIRWLITGSVGLDVVTRREKLGGTINDLERFDLQPLSPDAARSLIENLIAEGKCLYPFVIGAAEFDHLVRRLNWLSPFYIERLAVALRATGSAPGTRQATSGDVDRAFDALLSHGSRGYFAAWGEHIDNNFDSPERDRLRAVLSHLSASERGETRDTLMTVIGRLQPAGKRSDLRDALDLLISDGYLEEAESRYRFRSGLVREWWARWQRDDDP